MEIRPRHALVAAAIAGASFLGLGALTAASAQEDSGSSTSDIVQEDSTPPDDSAPESGAPDREGCEDGEGGSRGQGGQGRPGGDADTDTEDSPSSTEEQSS